MNNQIDNLINVELDKEAKRIFSILYEMYLNKIKVNMFITKLIKKNMYSKFKIYELDIQRKVIKLIPDDLNICESGEWVFVTNEDLIDNNCEEFYLTLDSIAYNIVEYIYNLNEDFDFFDILNNLTYKYQDINFESSIIKHYLIKKIILNLEKRNIKIVSLSPIKLEKLN